MAETIIKKQNGGKREGAGRKVLPPGHKKTRLVVYLDSATEQWVNGSGGSKFAAAILFAAHAKAMAAPQ